MVLTLLHNNFVAPYGIFSVAAPNQLRILSDANDSFGLLVSVGHFRTEWILEDSPAFRLGYRIADNSAFSERLWEASLNQVRE